MLSFWQLGNIKLITFLFCIIFKKIFFSVLSFKLGMHFTLIRHLNLDIKFALEIHNLYLDFMNL